MMIHIMINFKCIAKSIFIKLISAIIVIIFGIKLNVFIIPSDDSHLWAFILVNTIVLYMMVIDPLLYFIPYYLHDIKTQIFIDSENDTLKIIDSKVEYFFQMNEVLKITKFLERRYKNNYLGFFYYKIETIKGTFYISMFSTWTLNKSLPKIIYNEVDIIFPHIKETDIVTSPDNEDKL